MNRLYWKSLRAHTTAPFELIVIDNHSTDGSETFFRELAQRFYFVKYIRNERNQSYPASQIQGMGIAQSPVLCFFNNDIWMPYDWNTCFEKKLEENTLFVLSPSGQEAQPRQCHSDYLKRRWKNTTILSRIWKWCFRQSEESRLKQSLKWMYKDLDPFASPTLRLPNFNGIKGDAVVFHRDLLSVLAGPWDEQVEAADWHLYLQMARLHEANPKIPLPLVLTDVYIHHFGRYSARQEFEPLNVAFKKIEDLYSPEEMTRLWWGNRLPA